jgi:glycosyltransferase involved in cell wall biosynthesis
MTALSLIVCTYNNCRQLETALASIAAQRLASDTAFDLLVVDNNCTDDTATVVDAFAQANPALAVRRIHESRQGLTPARQCGAVHSAAEWIAFVDDDCVLEPDWVAQVLAFTRQNPRCGAIGGRVVLDYLSPPDPYLKDYGWLMGHQDFGEVARAVPYLVGAGLVLRRTALDQSGWTEKPLLQDRIAERLVSGGDMEIGPRIAAKNWQLCYLPACRLYHRIPERRMGNLYLRRLAFGLGASEVMVKALTWDGTQAELLGVAARRAAARSLAATKRACRALIKRRDLRPARLDASFARGNWAGIAHMLRLPAADRSEILGAARRADP